MQIVNHNTWRKKGFDSVNHDYIRKTLEAYGMECFVPVFNLLYSNKEVDIAVNNDVVEGYKIKNELKQGDSLSCILFILSIDPLIWNIQRNENTERIEINGIAAPKIVAYADDITCMINSKKGLRHIFREYEPKWGIRSCT